MTSKEDEQKRPWEGGIAGGRSTSNEEGPLEPASPFSLWFPALMNWAEEDWQAQTSKCPCQAEPRRKVLLHRLFPKRATNSTIGERKKTR